MKKIIKKNFFLPEEKEYLLWVFLGLFTFLLLQSLIYPKLKKLETYNLLTNNYRKELDEMNKKIADVMINKAELGNIENFLEKKLSYRGNIATLIKTSVIQKMPDSFRLINFSQGKSLGNDKIQIIPIYIEFSSHKNDLTHFLSNLNNLSLPLEILDLKIDGLSPQDISVKIQMIFEKRN